MSEYPSGPAALFHGLAVESARPLLRLNSDPEHLSLEFTADERDPHGNAHNFIYHFRDHMWLDCYNELEITNAEMIYRFGIDATLIEAAIEHVRNVRRSLEPHAPLMDSNTDPTFTAAMLDTGETDEQYRARVASEIQGILSRFNSPEMVARRGTVFTHRGWRVPPETDSFKKKY